MKRLRDSAAKALLDADHVLRIAADELDESDVGTLNDLRKAALDFAEAWHACEGKGRP